MQDVYGSFFPDILSCEPCEYQIVSIYKLHNKQLVSNWSGLENNPAVACQMFPCVDSKIIRHYNVDHIKFEQSQLFNNAPGTMRSEPSGENVKRLKKEGIVSS